MERQRLKLETREGSPFPKVDAGEIDGLLRGDGLLVSDLEEHQSALAAPGTRLGELLGSIARSSGLRLVQTPEGQALRYIDTRKIDELNEEADVAKRETKKLLEEKKIFEF